MSNTLDIMANTCYCKLNKNKRNMEGVLMMSYKSIRTIVSMVSGVLLVIAYVIYALSGAAPSPENLGLWAVSMLVFIGISVGTAIVIQIVFHIVFAVIAAVKERQHDNAAVERIINSSMVEDEREKMIDLKSSHVGYVIAGLGFVAALAALAFGWPALAMLHILMGAFFIGSAAEGILSIYYSEKGM